MTTVKWCPSSPRPPLYMLYDECMGFDPDCYHKTPPFPHFLHYKTDDNLKTIQVQPIKTILAVKLTRIA